MSFQLQVSNSLEQLAIKLCIDLKNTKKDVFQPSYIVTQTAGMNNWLKLKMAEKLGIAANYQFVKPNDIINKIYFLAGGTYSESLSPENLNWLIFKLLADESFTSKFPNIAAYYQNDTPDKDVKRMALAERISDLFDQYQIYRPEMIEAWNADAPAKSEEYEWQKTLWLNAKKTTGESFPDKTLISAFLKVAFSNPENVARLQQKMPVLHLFGISLITDYHLHIFQFLAQFIDVNFLILNPAPEIYWFEDKSEKQLAFLKKIGKVDLRVKSVGNPLLLNWGRIIQDTFAMLFKNEALLNTYDVLEGKDPGNKCLLHKIQHSIYQNEPIEEIEKFTNADIDDGSVVINSCYSPAREVEVLYNYLVHLVDKHKAQLAPGDIVVMVSDINLYASYIKAVFDNAPYTFKYTIADETFASSDSISNALNSLLAINEDNFSAEQVVSLLDSSYIRKRLQINDVSLIRNIVNEANIRFGMEGSRQDDSLYVSWNYGLKRIMYGICISGGLEFGNGSDSFYPLDCLEGGSAYEIIKFVHFVTHLMEAVKERRKPKTLEGWVAYVDQILHGYVCKRDETTDEDYLHLLSELENYNSFNELFTETVNYEVFMHSFLAVVSAGTSKNAFAFGGITFCSLIPMRSIPFKVVGLLGLNFDKFPRKENGIGFNLMTEERRKGDRNLKENDKHLFLETLLSAKDYLYISYIGQSIKDNTSVPPSTLVDELMDFIAMGSEHPKTIREQLLTRQPLHGFSKKYQGNNKKLYSYLTAGKKMTGNLQKEEKTDAIAKDIIPIQDLVRFLKQPIKGYYNKVLDIYYNEDETLIAESEIFELNTLQKWALKTQLLNITDDYSLNKAKDKLVKTGNLPLKNMAEIEILSVKKEVTTVQNLLAEITKNDGPRTVHIDLKLDAFHLTGSEECVYGNNLVIISWSKNENKNLLEAYIRYMAMRASGEEIEVYFISSQKEKVFKGEKVDSITAQNILKSLIKLYQKGHHELLAFDPGFGFKPKEIEELIEPKFFKVIIQKFEQSITISDAYLKKEYENGFFTSATVLNDYKAAAEELLVPLATFFPEFYNN